MVLFQAATTVASTWQDISGPKKAATSSHSMSVKIFVPLIVSPYNIWNAIL